MPSKCFNEEGFNNIFEIEIVRPLSWSYWTAGTDDSIFIQDDDNDDDDDDDDGADDARL